MVNLRGAAGQIKLAESALFLSIAHILLERDPSLLEPLRTRLEKTLEIFRSQSLQEAAETIETALAALSDPTSFPPEM
jgi:hypothetical protein